MMPDLRWVVEEIVTRLVAKDYGQLETLTKGQRLPAEEMASAIEEYGKTLVMPPAEAFDDLDVVEVKGSKLRTFGIRFPLWTSEEGRSDLTLELTVSGDADANPTIQIDDLHVL